MAAPTSLPRRRLPPAVGAPGLPARRHRAPPVPVPALPRGSRLLAAPSWQERAPLFLLFLFFFFFSFFISRSVGFNCPFPNASFTSPPAFFFFFSLATRKVHFHKIAADWCGKGQER